MGVQDVINDHFLGAHVLRLNLTRLLAFGHSTQPRWKSRCWSEDGAKRFPHLSQMIFGGFNDQARVRSSERKDDSRRPMSGKQRREEASPQMGEKSRWFMLKQTEAGKA